MRGMRMPSAAALLDAWDAGCHATGARRALLLARLAPSHARASASGDSDSAADTVGSPDAPPDTGPPSDTDLAHLPLGHIAARVLALRAALFGPALASLADCPRCGTVVESQVD